MPALDRAIRGAGKRDGGKRNSHCRDEAARDGEYRRTADAQTDHHSHHGGADYRADAEGGVHQVHQPALSLGLHVDDLEVCDDFDRPLAEPKEEGEREVENGRRASGEQGEAYRPQGKP